jgi:hypothetical protein
MRLIDPQGLQEENPGDATPHLAPNEDQRTSVSLVAIWLPSSNRGKAAAEAAIQRAIDQFAYETGVEIEFGGWAESEVVEFSRELVGRDGVATKADRMRLTSGLFDIKSRAGWDLVTGFTDQRVVSEQGPAYGLVVGASYLSTVSTAVFQKDRAWETLGHEWSHSFGVPTQATSPELWSYGGYGRRDTHFTHHELLEVWNGVGRQCTRPDGFTLRNREWYTDR